VVGLVFFPLSKVVLLGYYFFYFLIFLSEVILILLQRLVFFSFRFRRLVLFLGVHVP